MKYMMTRMQKLELGLGQTQQAMMGAFGVTNKRAAFHRKTMYAMHSVTLIGIVYHVGHSFGWW